MKKVFSIFIIILTCCKISSGQQIYFNNRYDYNSGCDLGWSLINKSNSYILAGESEGCTNPVPSICRIDSAGNIIWKREYNNFNNAGFSSVIALRNGDFLAVGSNAAGGIPMMRFNINGDTLWTKTIFGSTFLKIGKNCKEARDSGFIVTGYGFGSSGWDTIFLLKTDPSGNLQWEKRFGGPYGAWGFSVDTCSDGGFIIGGTWVTSFNSSVDFYPEAYLRKTDSAGNMQWQHWYPLSGCGTSALGVVALRNNNGYVFSGNNYIGCPYPGVNKAKIYIARTNSVGTIVWSDTIGPIGYYTEGGHIIKTRDNGYVISGQIADSSGNGTIDGALMKIDSSGNLKWYRNYEKLRAPQSNNYFRDVVQAPDGGFAACGFIIPNAPDTGTEDIWILKTDSNGCDSVNHCSSVISPTGMYEIKNDVLMFSVYPNPSSGAVNFSYQLPDDIPKEHEFKENSSWK